MINRINHINEYKLYIYGILTLSSLIFYLNHKKEQGIKQGYKVVLRNLITLAIMYFSLFIIRQIFVGFKINVETKETFNFLIISLSRVALPGLLGTLMILVMDIIFYYKSKEAIIERYIKIISYVLMMDIASLIVINKNITLEIFLTISILYFFVTILFLILNLEIDFKNKGKSNSNKNLSLRDDSPITGQDSLFPERKIELDNIINYINNYDSEEAITISINGRWGEGKTGIINCIIDEVSEGNNIIWIQPMVIDTRENLIKYFFSQLSIILENNNIYTGSNSYISQYMKLVLEILGKDSSIIDKLKVTNNNKSDDYREVKEKLQKDIYKIKNSTFKKILVVIDDFDRIDDENKLSILKFIKEIADFKGLIVIFAVDYENMINHKLTSTYLEKFIIKRFDLKKIHEIDIIKFYLKESDLLRKRFDNPVIKSHMEELREDFIDYFVDIKNDIKKLAEEKNEDGKSEIRVDNLIDIDEKNTKNPRRLKRLIIEIEDLYHSIYKKSSNNISTFDEKIFKKRFNELEINKAIIRFAYIKTFYEDEFTKIINHGSLRRYFETSMDNDDEKEKLYHSILWSIFKYVNYIPRYNTLEPDEDVIRFIDDYFVNHYTESYFTSKYLREEEKIKKLLENKNIVKSKFTETLDFVIKVLVIVFTNKINQMEKERFLFKIIEHMNYLIKEKIVGIDELINAISKNNNIRRVIGNESKFIKLFSKLAEENLISLKNQLEKENSTNNLERIKEDIVRGCGIKLIPALVIVKIDSDMDIYKEKEDLVNKIERISELKTLNAFIIKHMNYPINQQEGNEYEVLDKWSNLLIDEISNLNNIELIDLKIIMDNVVSFAKDIKNINRLIKKLNNLEIPLSERKISEIEKFTTDEFEENLKEIRTYFQNTKSDDRNYSYVIAYFIAFVKYFEGYEDRMNEIYRLNIINIFEEIYLLIKNKAECNVDILRLTNVGISITRLKRKIN